MNVESSRAMNCVKAVLDHCSVWRREWFVSPPMFAKLLNISNFTPGCNKYLPDLFLISRVAGRAASYARPPPGNNQPTTFNSQHSVMAGAVCRGAAAARPAGGSRQDGATPPRPRPLGSPARPHLWPNRPTLGSQAGPRVSGPQLELGPRYGELTNFRKAPRFDVLCKARQF